MSHGRKRNKETIIAHNPRSPFVLDLLELSRRPGSMREVSLDLRATEGFGTVVVSIPKDSELEVDARLESVVEGVLISGSVAGEAVGECVRCLDEVVYDVDATWSLCFAILSFLHYHFNRCVHRTARGCALSVECVWQMRKDTHTKCSIHDGRHYRACSTRRKRASRGCSKAQDVAQQHPCASFAVEDIRSEPHHVPAVQGRQVVAHCVPNLRYLQGPSVRRGAAHRARKLINGHLI